VKRRAWGLRNIHWRWTKAPTPNHVWPADARKRARGRHGRSTGRKLRSHAIIICSISKTGDRQWLGFFLICNSCLFFTACSLFFSPKIAHVASLTLSKTLSCQLRGMCWTRGFCARLCGQCCLHRTFLSAVTLEFYREQTTLLQTKTCD